MDPVPTPGTPSRAPDHWVRRGFNLRSILAEITGSTPSRIDLPGSLDNDAGYDFEIQGEAETTEQFLAMLKDQLGQVLTSAQRSIEIIAVRPAQ